MPPLVTNVLTGIALLTGVAVILALLLREAAKVSMKTEVRLGRAYATAFCSVVVAAVILGAAIEVDVAPHDATHPGWVSFIVWSLAASIWFLVQAALTRVFLKVRFRNACVLSLWMLALAPVIFPLACIEAGIHRYRPKG